VNLVGGLHDLVDFVDSLPTTRLYTEGQRFQMPGRSVSESVAASQAKIILTTGDVRLGIPIYMTPRVKNGRLVFGGWWLRAR
jgi:hypothetical protein